MRFRTKFLTWVVVMSLVLMIGFSTIPQTKARFVIAVLPYDTSKDGNFIASISAYYDSVFNDTMYYNPVSYPTEVPEPILEIDTAINLTLAVFCWVNGTIANISSLNEGLDIMRHSVVVTCINGTVVFSQNNFSYVVGGAGDAPMYFYRHDVILDFQREIGEIYTVIITYEVYY